MKKTLVTLLALMGSAMAETITLTMPATANNGGTGWLSAEAAITHFANNADGGYMFNAGGIVNPDTAFNEGILTTTDGVTSLTLAPRTGAAGSGEAIVLSGSNLIGYSVDSFTFGISESSCTTTAEIALTLAVIQKSNNSWSIVESTKGALTLNSGTELTLTLSQSIDWSDSCKVVAVIDNTAKKLSGASSPTYTLTGISMSAAATPAVPEPATTTLSLLALCGLAARRRRG